MICSIIETMKHKGRFILVEEIIKAKDVAETAVIVLLKGIKCKVAVRSDEGRLELKNRSIITQFLNPNNERKKMTKK